MDFKRNWSDVTLSLMSLPPLFLTDDIKCLYDWSIHFRQCCAVCFGLIGTWGWQGGSTKYNVNWGWLRRFRNDRDRRDLVSLWDSLFRIRLTYAPSCCGLLDCAIFIQVFVITFEISHGVTFWVPGYCTSWTIVSDLSMIDCCRWLVAVQQE